MYQSHIGCSDEEKRNPSSKDYTKKYFEVNMNKSKLDKQERIVIYSIIFILFVLLLLLLLWVTNESFPHPTIEKDAAGRIFDGVGFEGLSAIFAIVISLSLMAVQFASQQYTHRIMKIHINSLIFRFVIVIYLGSMLYNLIMLGSASAPNQNEPPPPDGGLWQTPHSPTMFHLF